MSHQISRYNRGMRVTFDGSDGTPVRLTDERVFAKEDMWHGLGSVFEKGLPIYTVEPYELNAYTAIDSPVYMRDGEVYEFETVEDVRAFLANGGEAIFDLDTEMKPIYIQVGGKRIMIEHAAVVNGVLRTTVDSKGNIIPAPNVLGTVRSGLTSEADWKRMNKGQSGYTRSANYEVITPRQTFAMMADLLYRETGISMNAASAGALGKHGEKGVWCSVPMPTWDGDVVSALGVEGVKSYLTFFIDPLGTMYVVETDIMVVCMNTWMMALERATRRLKVDHQLGAAERFRTALEGVWTANKEGQQLIQATAMWLRDNRVAEENVRLAAQAAFPMPGKPDVELVGVQSLDARRKAYEREVERVLALRSAFCDLHENPQAARSEFGVELGITPDNEATGFSLAQALSFVQTYYPGKPDNVIYSWFKGDRVKGFNAGLSSIMGGGMLEVGTSPDDFPVDGEPELVAVSGIGWTPELLSAYDVDDSTRNKFNPLQTQL